MRLEDRLRNHGDSMRRAELSPTPIEDVRARATRHKTDPAGALGAVSLIAMVVLVAVLIRLNPKEGSTNEVAVPAVTAAPASDSLAPTTTATSTSSTQRIGRVHGRAR